MDYLYEIGINGYHHCMEKADCGYGCCGSDCSCIVNNVKCHYCRKRHVIDGSRHEPADIARYECKNKFVCFNCKVSWKSVNDSARLCDCFLNRFKKLPVDPNCKNIYCYTNTDQPKDYFEECGSICSRCNEFGIRIGRDFRVPKKSDKKEWDKLKTLLELKVLFIDNKTYNDIKEDLDSELISLRNMYVKNIHKSKGKDTRGKLFFGIGLTNSVPFDYCSKNNQKFDLRKNKEDLIKYFFEEVTT